MERRAPGSRDTLGQPAARRGIGWLGICLLIGAGGIVLMILAFVATGYLAGHQLAAPSPAVTRSAASPSP